MDIRYNSTRGCERGLSSSQAVLKGLADDGGLFMPDRIPEFNFDIKELCGRSYQAIAYEVMKLLLTDYTEEELKYCIDKAYDSKFDTSEIAPVVKKDGAYYIELFHGKTIAFKDMALSILPYLMTTAAKKNNVTNKIIILTATSGDTGKAAMAGFADVEGTGIIVFYPKGGVSHIQQLQMSTQRGSNTHVVAIHGNFDDAQTGVKRIFGDRDFEQRLSERQLQLSSANSINIGRLIPQIVYYVSSYVKLLEEGEIKEGERVNICVPTGNFGNILAAYLAKKMGLPVNKLICASNDNKVLFDFFRSGVYDRNRDFILTSSPSMDILISSNLERLIYMSCGCDARLNTRLMEQLKKDGRYEISADMKKFISDFEGGYASEAQVAAQIKKLYEATGYVMDTHTAVASYVYSDYIKRTGDDTKTLIASTASPYKFAASVMSAIDGELGTDDDWKIIDMLNRTSRTAIPAAINDIKNAPVLHKRECDAAAMQNEVADILGL